jgi:hypothetical protein
MNGKSLRYVTQLLLVSIIIFWEGPQVIERVTNFNMVLSSFSLLSGFVLRVSIILISLYLLLNFKPEKRLFTYLMGLIVIFYLMLDFLTIFNPQVHIVFKIIDVIGAFALAGFVLYILNKEKLLKDSR